MPASPMSAISRAATREPGEPLNILTFPTHERYETSLSKTGHNFYSITNDTMKDWKVDHGDIPDNYHIYKAEGNSINVPLHLDFDLIFSQSKFGQFEISKNIAKSLHLPIVTLEHTLPLHKIAGGWPQEQFLSFSQMTGCRNVFISDYSMKEWEWDKREDSRAIYHGVDSETFSPDESLQKTNHVLSVANQYKKRDYCLGYSLWKRVTNGLPTKLVGDNPGMSEPSSSIEDLVSSYRTAKVFLNTSTISPIPMSLLEAMSCGCAVVSTATCVVPEIIENGVNGFITNSPEEMKYYVELLLSDEVDSMRSSMGREARNTILSKFSVDRFISEWNEVFEEASQTVYTGA